MLDSPFVSIRSPSSSTFLSKRTLQPTSVVSVEMLVRAIVIVRIICCRSAVSDLIIVLTHSTGCSSKVSSKSVEAQVKR